MATAPFHETARHAAESRWGSPGRAVGYLESEMQVLAIERPAEDAGDDEVTPELLADEARRVWQLHQAGVIREIYFREDRSSAVVFLECPDAEAAAAVLETLPLVHAGLIEFEVIPLRAYPGFGRLFAQA